MSDNKKQSLLTGAGVLAAATVVVKLIGAVYKIPVTNLLGTEGYGYFTGAYAVYTPLYAVSMAGLPVAISKFVSQNMQLGRIKDAKAVFSIAQKMFLAVGLLGTLILMAISVPYSVYSEAPMNYISVITVAPCVLFCCLMSSYRGYYEGLNNMTPTGISQVIEAAVKLVFGLAAAYVFMTGTVSYYEKNAVDGVMVLFGQTVTDRAQAMAVIYPYGAAVAISGVTLGSAVGLLYLYIFSKRKGLGFTREELVNSPAPEGSAVIAKKLIRFAIPVAASSLVLNITNLIDDITIRSRLAVALEADIDTVKAMFSETLRISQTLDENIATYLYGMHGSVINIKNLVPTLTMTLGISAIPVLSKAWAIKDNKSVRLCVESAIRVAMLVAMPAGLGLLCLSEPILALLYGGDNEAFAPSAAFMMGVYGLFMSFFALASPLTNMLQAIGKTKIPIITLVIGSAVKLMLILVLIPNPNININGACISSAVCYVILVSVNLFMLLKYTKIRLNIISVFVKPFIAALFCGAAAWGSNYALTSVIGIESRLTAVVSVAVGGAFYAIVLIFIKGIAKDDLDMLPKGEKIAKVLAKFGLLG